MDPHTLPPEGLAEGRPAGPPDEAALLRAMRINSAISLAGVAAVFAGIALLAASIFIEAAVVRYEYYPVTTYHVDMHADAAGAVVLAPDDPAAGSAADVLMGGSGAYRLNVIVELERPVPSRGSKSFHPGYRQPSDDEIARALPNSAVDLRFFSTTFAKGEMVSLVHPFDGTQDGLGKTAALPAEIVSRALPPLADHVLALSGDAAFADCVRAGGCPRTPLPGVSRSLVLTLQLVGIALLALGSLTASISRVRAARTHRDIMAHLS